VQFPARWSAREWGFDLGVAILDYLGLAFLAVYVGKSLLKAVSAAGQAVSMAWDSVDDERSDLDRAALAHRLGAGCSTRVFPPGIARRE
jgi:hypothetical protein